MKYIVDINDRDHKNIVAKMLEVFVNNGISVSFRVLEEKLKPENLQEMDARSIDRIFNYYKGKICPAARMTDAGRTKVVLRLKKFGEEPLIKAINNFANNPWRMDNNADRGMAWFFHSDDRIDQFINMKGHTTQSFKI